MKVYTIIYETEDHGFIGDTFAKKNDAVRELESDGFNNVSNYEFWSKEINYYPHRMDAEIHELEVIGS